MRLALLALFFLTACRAVPDDTPDIVVTLDPEFTVDLFEQRNPADGHSTLGLWVESTAIYPCEQVAIDAEAWASASTVDVLIRGIQQPDTCTGAPGQARRFLALPPLAPGQYDFYLEMGPTLRSSATLTAGPERLTLQVREAQGVDFRYRELFPLPEGLLWGYVRVPDETLEPLSEDFLKDLKLLTTEPNLTPGYYSYFTMSGTQQAFFHPAFKPAGVHKVFVRRFSGNPDALRALMQGYRSGGTPLPIRCWSTVGEL